MNFKVISKIAMLSVCSNTQVEDAAKKHGRNSLGKITTATVKVLPKVRLYRDVNVSVNTY
jgi:hypothetical protein